MQTVQTQNHHIFFQLFLIKPTAFFSLIQHQRADSSGNRLNRFCHRNLIGTSIHFCGRQVNQPTFLQCGPGKQDILQACRVLNRFSFGIFSRQIPVKCTQQNGHIRIHAPEYLFDRSIVIGKIIPFKCIFKMIGWIPASRQHIDFVSFFIQF